MNKLAKMTLGNSLALNQRLARTAANGIDWLFKRDTLIESGRTWFELVLVPPLGVTTETFDLMPQRSLVRYMAARGFRTYLVDWGKPKKEHAHLNLKDYSYVMLGSALEKIREHSGSKEISLMGWCMGGLLCLLHQGQVLGPDIRNIVTVASPIDLESGRGAVAGVANIANGSAQLVSNYTNLRLQALDPARLALPPWATTLVFKMTDPVGSVTTYWDLVTRMSDRESLKSYSTTADYLNNMLLYPGGVLQDMAVKVMGEGQLARGKVEIGDHLAELDRINSNLLAFAGETDILVPKEIAEKIVDIVASRDKEFRIAPGGHMGVIIGSKAQNAVWAQSADWLAQRSGAKAAARRGKAPARKKAAKRPRRKQAGGG